MKQISRYLKLSIVLVISFIEIAQAQYNTNNLKKYWFYRYRLINDFMKRAFPITIAFFFLLVAAGMIACKKKATKVNPDYEGSWCHRQGKQYFSLIIDEKSHGVYEEHAESTRVKHKEGTVRIKDNKLHVGLFFSITIEQEPTKFDSVVSGRGCTGPHSWYMILRTDTFYRSIYN